MESEVLRLCGVALLCAIAATVVGKQYGGAHETIRLAGLVLALGGVASLLGAAVSYITDIFSAQAAAPYVSLMLKAMGIASVCGICSELCREMGAAGAANAVESAGGLAIVALTMPTVAQALEAAVELIERT